MGEVKTRPQPASVDAFLEQVEPARRRDDAKAVRAMMERLSGDPATMWGSAIIGFGRYPARTSDGAVNDWPRIGFSPRKAALSLYLTGCYCDGGLSSREATLARLGKHKRGASCLYINKLDDIDLSVLEELMRDSLDTMDRLYPRDAPPAPGG